MRDELERKYRVINMMISMHSIMHHRFKAKAFIGKVFFLISAIVLNVFIFFDYDYLSFLDIKEEVIKNIISLTSFIIFLLSVIFMLIEWSNKSESHKQATNQLSRLLNELRLILSIKDEKTLNEKSIMFNQLYNQTCETIPKIPDKRFNSLKAKHYQKLELSKFIDKNKGKPFLVIKLLYNYNKAFKSNE